MVRRMALTVCLLGSCVWCMGLVTRADGTATAQAVAQFKPVASVGALMHGQLSFFKKISKSLESPASEDRNHELEHAAEVLAELANVNRLNKDKEDYRGWATDLRETALELAREAAKLTAADDVRMKKLTQKMKASCTACHDAYQ